MTDRLGKLTRIVLGISAVFAMTGCGLTSWQGVGRAAPTLDDAGYPDPYSEMESAREAFARGNYGIAIGHLERELGRRPASVAALNGLGSSYDKLGRYVVAQRYYFRALNLAPESSITIGNIGYSYLLQGRREEATQLLRLALRYDATNTVAAANLGLAMEIPVTAPRELAVTELGTSDGRSSQRLPEPELKDVVLAAVPVQDSASTPTPTPALDSNLRVEISNGNGVTGMAARLRGFLQEKGARIVRLTNADEFSYVNSTIYYRGGMRESAEALAATFPTHAIRLQQSDRLADWVDARLRIGRDFSDFEAEHAKGQVLVQRTQ